MAKQNLKPIEIRDLLDYQFPENLQYCPSGEYLAFQVAKAREESNDYERNIWLAHHEKVEQITYSIDSSIICWQDDTHLIIKRVTDQNVFGTELFLLDVKGGEAKKMGVLPFPVTSMKKVKDGLYAVLGTINANDPDAYKDDEKTRKEKQAQKEKDKDYQVIDEVPYWHNNQGYTNKNRTALFTVTYDGSFKCKRISKPFESVQSIVLKENDVYFLSETHTSKESRYNELHVLHTASGKRETVYTKKDYVIQKVFFLDGILYGLAADLKSYGLNQTPDFVRIEKNKLTFVKDPHRRFGASGGSDVMLGGGKPQEVKHNHLYTLVTNEDRVEIWTYDSSLNETVLFDKDGICFYLDVSSDKIAFAYEDSKAPTEIYEMDLDGSHLKKLTNLNGDSVKGKYVATPHAIHYTSTDTDLTGYVLLPKDYNPKKKYPAVLDIHGGPRVIYGQVFFHEMQVWASKGYFVFFTNIRGSDGRDDDFADIRGKYGTVDYENLMDFTDAVLKQYPAIDEKRLCVTGGSYGGFMTNWIIGHTNRFACAASQRSIASWISLTFMADIGLWYDPGECGLDVDESLFDGFDRMWNSSPLKYIEGAKTPTLFIHSDEDYRCPLPEGMQMMQALAYQNVETRMVIFHGENHELSRSGKPTHRMRRLTEITDWFDKHTGEKKNGKK